MATAAPPLSATFEGINFSGDSIVTGTYDVPADANAAAGPADLVAVNNASIAVYTKTGGVLSTQSLRGFFSSLNPSTPTFDAKVLYDPSAGRFVVETLEKTDTANGASADTSRILLAVSQTSDPSGGWYFAAVNSELGIGGANTWLDFPGFAIDGQAIYITGNMFGFGGGGSFVGSRLFIINKSGLYSGGSVVSTSYDPSVGSGVNELLYLQPAQVHGTMPGTTGTFLVASSGLTDGTNDFLAVIRIDNPTSGSATFNSQFLNLGAIDSGRGALLSAPQEGSSTPLEAGDDRILSAVWQNNVLWAANTVKPPAGSGPDAGQATAHWFEIDTSNLASLALIDQGNVGGEDIAAGTSTFDPTINVDAAGNMAMSFSASGPGIFSGAYYTSRLASDPAHTTRPSATLAAGMDYYVRELGYGRNRWGDYNSISIDPTDNSTFWVYNQYAMSRGTPVNGEDGQWGTRLGAFSLQAAVVGVSVRSATSGTLALQTAADGLRLLPAGRSTDVSLGNINQINIVLSAPAPLSSSDITVGSAIGMNYGPVTVSGSAGSYTLTLARPITAADRVTISIGNSGIASWVRRIDVLPGDANDDGVVTFSDFVMLSNAYGQPAARAPFADFNGDGQIDFADFVILSNDFGSALPPLAGPAARARVIVRSSAPA
ncbi:MAG TPA: dockerin type I domain-containing protein [Tepidisphaeraceae bacterium]|nr:dockerin type I domain-containing protein [Tepidisphaeraceae bacterium]